MEEISDKGERIMQQPALVVMAAGMGSRFGGLKQIEPVDGQGHILMDFSLFDAYRAGFRELVFIIKPELEESFRARIGSRMERYFHVHYVFQTVDQLPEGYAVPEGRVKPWGTGHALLCAAQTVSGPFAVINADDFYGRDAFFKAAEFIKNADENGSHFCMVGYHLGNTLTDNGSVARGECYADENGMLTKITERTKLFKEEGGAYYEDNGETVHIPNDTVVSMNFWGFTPKVFEGLEFDFNAFLNDPEREPLKSECLLPNTIGKMINAGECDVKVLTTTAKWFGVTYANDKPDVIAKLRALIDAGEYPSDGLWN